MQCAEQEKEATQVTFFAVTSRRVKFTIPLPNCGKIPNDTLALITMSE
jgi:hypothetical protein